MKPPSSQVVKRVSAMVSEGGEHAPTWAFSSCSCGWVPEVPAEGRRLPQFIGHIVALLATPQPTSNAQGGQS